MVGPNRPGRGASPGAPSRRGSYGFGAMRPIHAPQESIELDLLCAPLAGQVGAKSRAYSLGLCRALVSAPSKAEPLSWLEGAILDISSDQQELARTLREPVQELLHAASLLKKAKEPGISEGESLCAVASWCQGYLAGVAMDPKWQEDPQALLFSVPLAHLSRQAPSGEEPSTLPQSVQKCLLRIPYVVALADRYWSEERPERQ